MKSKSTESYTCGPEAVLHAVAEWQEAAALPDGPGSYLLVARLSHRSRIQVGRLGAMDFSAGFYVYCGSAIAGLSGRIRRHLRNSKKLHWHIDYLLTTARVEEVWFWESPQRLECRLSRQVSALKGARLVLSGFGASDCSCQSHLWYFRKRPRDLGYQ